MDHDKTYLTPVTARSGQDIDGQIFSTIIVIVLDFVKCYESWFITLKLVAHINTAKKK